MIYALIYIGGALFFWFVAALLMAEFIDPEDQDSFAAAWLFVAPVAWPVILPVSIVIFIPIYLGSKLGEFINRKKGVKVSG